MINYFKSTFIYLSIFTFSLGTSLAEELPNNTCAELQGFWAFEKASPLPDIAENINQFVIKIDEKLNMKTVGVNTDNSFIFIRYGTLLPIGMNEAEMMRPTGRVGYENGAVTRILLTPAGFLVINFYWTDNEGKENLGLSIEFRKITELEALSLAPRKQVGHEDDDGEVQDYTFANQFCEKREQLSDSVKMTVDAIVLAANKQAEEDNESFEDAKANRSKFDQERTDCQILEDYIEHGMCYAATGGSCGHFRGITIFDIQLGDLSPLASLSPYSIRLSHNQINDISALAANISLKSLDISHNPIENISVLSNFKKLSFLGLFETEIKDFSVIGELKTLERLDVDSENFNDLSMLTDLTHLRSLDIRKGTYQSLQAIESLPLESLSIMEAKVQDLTGLEALLAGRTKLKVRLFRNTLPTSKKAELEELMDLYPTQLDVSETVYKD